MTSAIIDCFRRDFAPVVSIIEQSGASISIATEIKDPSASGPRAVVLISPPNDRAFGVIIYPDRAVLGDKIDFRLSGYTEDSNARAMLALIERLGHSLAARGEHDRA